MWLPFPLGRQVNFVPNNVLVGFKNQKTQRSIQELLLNTKISGISGQKTLFFSLEVTLELSRVLCLSSSLLSSMALLRGIQARDR